jgi:2-keto-myo-inositol isomerase
MAAPQLVLPAFFALARNLGLTDVEIRNDIAGQPILDGTPAATVRGEAERAGVSILTINALQRFNDWSAAREREAAALATYARDAGAKAIILVPTNDGSGREDGLRQERLRAALTALKPILAEHGVTGLVEPLGFASSSLRLKREAIDAIRAVGGDIFKVTHDTFHHHLAGEAELFPEMTGLVHVSGVDDASLATTDMRDAHRVLVGPADRLGNIAQLRRLRAGGYSGAISFEPFAESLRHVADPAAGLRQSIAFIEGKLAQAAA